MKTKIEKYNIKIQELTKQKNNNISKFQAEIEKLNHEIQLLVNEKERLFNEDKISEYVEKEQELDNKMHIKEIVVEKLNAYKGKSMMQESEFNEAKRELAHLQNEAIEEIKDELSKHFIEIQKLLEKHQNNKDQIENIYQNWYKLASKEIRGTATSTIGTYSAIDGFSNFFMGNHFIQETLEEHNKGR